MKYVAATLLILAGFAWAERRGYAVGGAGRQRAPQSPSVRSSPGGYRSYHFWHTGFHGGK